MVKQDEVFFQILEPQQPASAPVPAAPPTNPQNPSGNISKK